MSFDLDDVLDLELQFHTEGYQQGLSEDSRKEYIEGKEYGYQVSFQRYLAIGYYRKIIETWLKELEGSENGDSKNKAKLNSTRKTLEGLEEQIRNLKFDNSELAGNEFDELTKKLKLKMRLLNVTMSKLTGTDKLQDMAQILQQIGGVLEIEQGDKENDVDNGMW